jgi:RHS repeat-associated protein
MGGGVGGLLYSLRPSQPIGFTHYNHRGDVVAKTDGAGSLTWQAAYEAFGTRRSEFGTTPDRQKANTKEEDPSGLVNENHRYRDLETGVFMTKDPAGFIDGPNLYAYVRQNPWSKFDPEGLSMEEILIGNQAVEAERRNPATGKDLAVFGGIVIGAPLAFTFGPALLTTKAAASAVVAGQAAITAYNTSPAVRGAVDGAITGAVTYADTGDPQAAVTNGLLVGVTTYASTPKGGAPSPGGKSAQQTTHETAESVRAPKETTRIYHRLNDPPDVVAKVKESGELWGAPPRNTYASDIPKAKAYDGPLPEGAFGFEFKNSTAPDVGHVPGQPVWSGNRPGVVTENGWAKIKVEVTKDTVAPKTVKIEN